MTAALLRRFRGIAIALVVLALSATAAFAAAPVLRLTSGPAAGTQAEEPEANENENDQGEDADDPAEDADDPGEDAQDNEDVETPDAEEADQPDSEEAGASEDTHGALVSAAAAMETPDGFANHGAFVSCVAKMKDVKAAEIDWTTVTPESCAPAPDEQDAKGPKANGDAKPHGTGNGKGRGAEMKALHGGRR